MSSKFLHPLISNNLETFDLGENTNIDEVFKANGEGTVKSLADLMKIVDKQCLKPDVTTKTNSSDLSKRETCFQEKVAEGFENLFTTGKFSDFVITVNKSQFRVHKSVLVIQSLGFSELFEKDEKSVEMKIKDLSVEAVNEFLYFLYTGKLSDKAENYATEIFELASRLKIPELKNITKDMFLSRLNVSNALQIFNLGHRYGSKHIKALAFQEIQKMFPGKNLAERFMEQPEKLKELIDAKQKLESVLESLKLFDS